MKIIINYDLLDKIREAKTGFSLQKTTKSILGRTGVYTTIIVTIDSFFSLNPEEILKDFFKSIIFGLNFYTLTVITTNLIFSNFTKAMAKDDLIKLASLLNTINVNTDSELILESYKYKTEYEFNKDNNSKELIQKKYIVVPVYDNDEEKEISLVQEHVIGSKTYSLSCGEPTKQKVLRLALNPM